MTEKQRNEQKAEIPVPILATAALNAAGQQAEPGSDGARIQQLLIQLIEDQLDKRNKEKQQRERLALSAIAAAADEKRMRTAQQKHCAHRKQDNTTRLVGQHISGTGQLSLVCQFCNANFYYPPDEKLGQIAPPRDLMPTPDEIGG